VRDLPCHPGVAPAMADEDFSAGHVLPSCHILRGRSTVRILHPRADASSGVRASTIAYIRRTARADSRWTGSSLSRVGDRLLHPAVRRASFANRLQDAFRMGMVAPIPPDAVGDRG
jgi:hypothetical protein